MKKIFLAFLSLLFVVNLHAQTAYRYPNGLVVGPDIKITYTVSSDSLGLAGHAVTVYNGYSYQGGTSFTNTYACSTWINTLLAVGYDVHATSSSSSAVINTVRTSLHWDIVDVPNGFTLPT